MAVSGTCYDLQPPDHSGVGKPFKAFTHGRPTRRQTDHAWKSPIRQHENEPLDRTSRLSKGCFSIAGTILQLLLEQLVNTASRSSTKLRQPRKWLTFDAAVLHITYLSWGENDQHC